MGERQGSSQETKEAIARVLVLPDLGKFELLDVLVRDLGVELDKTSKDQRRVRQRKEALQALLAVAEHLNLPAGKAPTTTQFNQAADELGLDWNTGKVIRVWETWRLAQETFTGQRRSSAFLNRDFRAVQDRRRKDQEEPIRGVKRWLESQPEAETPTAYDDFARRFNPTRKPGEGRLRLAESVRTGLGLRWPSVLAVARGERSVKRAREHELAELLPKRSTEHALLGVAGIVRLLGRGRQAVEYAIDHSRHFPTPVAVINGNRAWLYEDLKRYKRGLAAPKRSEAELQYLYMDAPGLHIRLELTPGAFKRRVRDKRWDLVPRPEGTIAAANPYWLRAKVEDWLRIKGKAELTPEQEDEIKMASARRAAAIGASLGRGALKGRRRPGKRRKRLPRP